MTSRVLLSRGRSMVFTRMYRTYLTGAAIIWAVSLALSLAAYVLVVRPQHNSKKRLESTLTEQKQLHVSARRAAQEQTRIQLNQQIEELRQRVRNFVVDSDESTDLTFDISQIASRVNLNSLSVTMGAQKGAGRRRVSTKADADSTYISENHIDITFTAGFYQFASFVNALERHRPVLFINEFTITRSKQDESAYHVTLDVAAFVRKQQNKETADSLAASAVSVEI